MSEGEPIVSVGTLSELAQRFIIRAVASSGHEEIAHWIEEWPELLGDKVGAALKNVLQKSAQGESVTENDTRSVADALSKDPKSAATLLGLLTADLLEGAEDADSQRKTILQTYRSVLEVICTFMIRSTTSLALKGFIHREDCISYWHFERKNLQFAWSGTDYLYPNGLQVYFIEGAPDDSLIASLNKQIRDDPERHLPAELYDFKHKPDVAELEHIYETKVTFNRLNQNASAPAASGKPDPFGLNAFSRQDEVSEYSQGIPSDLTALKGLIDSLFLAKAAQKGRTDKARGFGKDIVSREKAS
jgi:hypothetical protein